MGDQDRAALSGPYASLEAKFAAVSQARSRLESMHAQGLIDYEFLEEALADLAAIRASLEAEQDALVLTGPVSPVLGPEEIADLGAKVQDLQNHNGGEAAARGILIEIFARIGAAT